MIITINPMLAAALLSGSIFGVSYMLGLWRGRGDLDGHVEHVITQMIEMGYLKSRTRSDGEVELIRIDDIDELEAD